MSVNNNPSPPEEVVVRGTELRLFMLLQGMRKNLPPLTGPVVFGAVTYPGVAELTAAIEAMHGRYATVRSLEEQLGKARIERDENHQSTLAALKTAEAFVSGLIGVANPDLAKFGFKPRKARRQLTAAEKAVRAEKAKATRAKRGTLGKRAKQAIKGTVGDVVIRADGTVTGNGNGSHQPGSGQPTSRIPS